MDLARSAAQSGGLSWTRTAAALVDGLLAALSGDLPAQFLEEGRGSLLGCLWKLASSAMGGFARWCGASLEVMRRTSPPPKSPATAGAVSVDPQRRSEHGERGSCAVLPDQ